MGDLSYTFIDDAGIEQTMVLQSCLNVLQCAVCLICPCQTGAEARNSSDGFNATYDNSILTVNGHPTTIRYDTIFNLPMLFC